MSDSFAYTPGAGGELGAADRIGGLLFQRVKMVFGPDGTALDVSAADPLPVTASSLPLPTGAATEATLASLLEATAIEDTASPGGERGMVILAQRRDTDAAATSADGDYATLKMDEAGRLKTASQPAGYPATVGTINAVNGQVAVNCSRVSNVMIQMRVPSAVAGHNCTFEGSLNSTNGTDGNWFTIQAVRSNANTIETATGALAATPGYAWECSVNGLNWFRVRATAHTSGAAEWIVQPASYATEPIPAAQVSATQAVSGSVTATLAAANVRAGFIAASGIWYDDSSTALGASATFTGTSRDATGAATGAAWAANTTYGHEVRACAESDVAGTLWLEVSRDNTNWRRIQSVATTAVTGGGQAAELIYSPAWRYWRVGYTNGAGAQARFTLGTIAVAI